MPIPTAVAAMETRANALMQAAASPATPEQDPAPDDTRQNDQAPKPDETEYWKNRFSVMQGKYNAEVPALAERLRTLEAQLEEAKRKPVEPVRVTTDEDREILGDQMDSIRRVAQEEMATKLAEQAEEIRLLRTQLGNLSTNVGAATRETFIAAMDRNFPPQKEGDKPYWHIVNEQAEFIAWLNLLDPFSGRTRMEGLQEANAANDHVRVSAIFSSFLSGSAAPQLRNDTVDPPNARITPPSAPRRTPTEGVSGRTWSQAQIKEFYAQKFDAEVRNRGPLVGKADEILRLEQDIAAAQAEGRIVA